MIFLFQLYGNVGGRPCPLSLDREMVDFIAIIGILYDLDFPEVIEIKKKLLPENECYTDFLIS
jgi:hypothetical protein